MSYCGVGCGQLIYHRAGKVIAVEGDPASPISEGHLCPKGSATHQLLTHSGRLQKVRYRAPYSTAWQDVDLETAMDMIADRVWESRGRTFREERDGQVLMQCGGIAHLGGATLDNEENYLIRKLFTGGLGIVNVSNQAGYDIAPRCPVWARLSAVAVRRPRSRTCSTPTPS